MRRMRFKEAEHQMAYDMGYIDGYRQAVYDILTNADFHIPENGDKLAAVTGEAFEGQAVDWGDEEG